MDMHSYARRFPFDLLVWNAGVWHLNGHHQTHIDAILAATLLTPEFGATSLRIWDNHAAAPLEGWAGISA